MRDQPPSSDKPRKADSDEPVQHLSSLPSFLDRVLMGTNKKAAFRAFWRRPQQTGRDEWYTPAEYIESARKVMGSIDVDPASNPQAHVLYGSADTYYSDENSALSIPWKGNIWMNPPYSPKLVKAFVKKFSEEVEAGHVRQAILLTRSSTETQWFHALLDYATAVCFKKGRITFHPSDLPWNPEQKVDPAQFPSAFLYMGPNLDAFVAEFKQYGAIAQFLK